MYSPDEDSQGFGQFSGQGGGHKFREDFRIAYVRTYDILQSVFHYETVEPVGRDDYGPGHGNPHVLPFVVQVVFVQYVVQKGQTPGFASEGTVSQTGETDGVVIAFVVETCYDSNALIHTEIVNHSYIGLPYAFNIAEFIDGKFPEMVCQRKEASGIEPSGDIIPFAQVYERLVRDGFHNLLEIVKVASSCNATACFRIRNHKIPEAEAFTYVFAQLVGEGLGCLEYESGSECLRPFPHTFL